MTNYNNETCASLRRRLNQIADDFCRFPGMSENERSRLEYERGQIEAVLRNKLTAMLEEDE